MDYDNTASGDLAEQELFTKVFAWMTLALGLTAVVSMLSISTGLVNLVLGNRFIFFGLIIGELIMVFVLAGKLESMSPAIAQLVFLGYSALNGLTFSAIFLAYTSTSIVSTFAVTAGIFGFMAVYGYNTDRDLTSFGSFALMGLVGVIIASLVNMFLQSTMLYWIITYAGVIIFTGLVAYDTQKIKRMAQQGATGDKAAVMGALALYLDFINLFIYLLRIFGNEK